MTENDQLRQSREDLEVVKNFSQRYYNVFDTRRHDVHKFYHADATLIWNGTDIHGENAIAQYLTSLPATKHHIYALDFFPMKDLFPDEPTTYQVFLNGAVTYGPPESLTVNKEKRLFSHLFVLTVDLLSSTWLITSECFRFHE